MGSELATELTMRYSWTPTCSTLAQKYQRYGYVHTRPFLPGERYSVTREMERNMRGYKELQSELKEVRQTLAKQEYTRQSLPKTVVASFYKSPVGCRTSKGEASSGLNLHPELLFS